MVQQLFSCHGVGKSANFNQKKKIENRMLILFFLFNPPFIEIYKRIKDCEATFHQFDLRQKF